MKFPFDGFDLAAEKIMTKSADEFYDNLTKLYEEGFNLDKALALAYGQSMMFTKDLLKQYHQELQEYLEKRGL